jgi:hypothetical protein
MPPDEVRLLWDEHRSAPFPDGLAGEEIAGVDIVMLDADIAGCVATALGNHGRPAVERKAVLAKCLDDLDRVLPLLQDEGAREYYERLRRLAQLTLT